MTVGTLLSNVQANNEQLEVNLCTMLQSVRGTKQYWFLRKSELRCMIREWGSPTLFLTFSCAEYESPDIENYLRKVNDVPPSYNVGKLCTEDPISVSRKFSQEFTLLSKGSEERRGAWYGRPLLLEKGIPSAWCPTLSCPSVDQRCTSDRSR